MHLVGHAAPDFATCYRENYSRVYNYVFYRLLDRSQTEDVVSEAFFRAARAFDGFDASKASFSTWVIAIAKNCIIDLFRRSHPSGNIEDIPERVFATEDSYDELDETHEEAVALLALLNEEEREIIYCKYYREMKNAEIAEELGLNASTVATKLSRALAKMRAHGGEH